LKVPIITTITGEGGSGGALAIAVADRVLMLENSVYSVITPEGCASIMWRDASKRDLAAQALRITAEDMIELGVVDEVISEPAGGAHLDYDTTAANLSTALQKHLSEVRAYPPGELTNIRYDKFRKMAQFFQESA
jgi:acetyl-CoA carboxylase carboxyl transferase subunit alpha